MKGNVSVSVINQIVKLRLLMSCRNNANISRNFFDSMEGLFRVVCALTLLATALGGSIDR